MGPKSCQVCAEPLGVLAWRLDDGRVWCGRHAADARCRYCGFPVVPAAGEHACSVCTAAAVSRSDDIVGHRRVLRAHMDRLGLQLPAPTRIRLIPPGQPLTVSRGARGSLGRTRWRTSRGRLKGPITIEVAGGLPAHLFRRTLAHEFGHAAVAGGRCTDTQPLEVLEGFAECVSLEHLTAVDGHHAQKQIAQMRSNPDPVYGGGLRLVYPWVERHGLVAVAEALRSGGISALRR